MWGPPTHQRAAPRPRRRAAGERDADGVGDRFGDVVGIVDLAGVLRERLQRRNGIHRLMGALEPVGPLHGTADRHHRVLLGGGGDQSGGQIRGAGARRHQCDARCSGEPADRGGHERRVLLVTADDQLRAAVSQSVVNGVDLGARHAEDESDAVGGEGFDHALSGSHVVAQFIPPRCGGSGCPCRSCSVRRQGIPVCAAGSDADQSER